MLALTLGLSASLAWGLADFFGGLQSRRRPLLVVILASQLAGLAMAGVVVATLAGPAPPVAAMIPALAAGVTGAAALATFYRALQIGTMTIVAPIAATGAVVPVLAGLAGGERPSPGQVAGMALAILGVVLASRAADQPAAGRRIARRSVAFALLAAVLIGVTLTGYQLGAQTSALWTVFLARAMSASIFAVVMLGMRPVVALPARAWPALAVIGIMDVGANALFAVATTHGLLSVVAVLGSLYPVITVLLARGVLGERVGPVQQIGVAGALAGVVLMAGT